MSKTGYEIVHLTDRELQLKQEILDLLKTRGALLLADLVITLNPTRPIGEQYKPVEYREVLWGYLIGKEVGFNERNELYLLSPRPAV